MDLEAATAKFDKEQYFRELATGGEKREAAVRDPFFDMNLSNDASDARSEPRPKGGWQKQKERDRKMDELTFGLAEVSAYEKSLHQHRERDQQFSRPHQQHGANRLTHAHGHSRPIQQPRRENK